MSEYKLYLGNCLDHLEFMPDNSVDSIVTDPPYGLSFMGKKWDYDVPAVEIWAECLRVLKPGGHLLAFAGTRTQHRMACNIEDAGFEIRDMVTFLYDTNETAKALIESLSPEQIKMLDATFGRDSMVAWAYGSGFPKSHNLNGDWQGWGTALKPAIEPVTVARKPFKGTVAANVRAHGTGALGIDACRIPTDENLNGGAYAKFGNRGSLEGDLREGVAQGMFQAGKTADTDYVQPVGRWPANIIHDGSDAVMAAFPEAKGQQGALTGNEPSWKMGSANCYGKMDRRHEAAPRIETDKSAARFFKQIEVTDAEWLENLSPALIAGSTLSLSKLADAIAQSDAATSALPEGRQLSVLEAPSTSVTPSESKLIATSVITAIKSIASASLLAQQPEKLSLSHSHVSVAAHQTPTGTMTITVSLSSSAGCAENITFSITPKNSEAGEKACEQSLARFMYCAKASRKDRNEGLQDPGPQFQRGATLRKVENTDTKGNNHPTVKPTDLMAYLCRLVTPPGGIVLDPFMGSGSTGKAAIREGFQFVGIEMDPEYLAIAEARIKHEANKNTL